MQISTFRDITSAIEWYRRTIDVADEEIDIWTRQLHKNSPKGISGVDYSGMPKGSKDATSIDRIVEYIDSRMEIKAIAQQALKRLEKQKETTLDEIMQMDGITHRVAYLKIVEGLSLQDIADKLGYSLDWIKRVSATIGKKITL